MQPVLLLTLVVGATAGKGGDSPVAKVIELLQDNKVKVQADLDAETKEMVEYTEFCDTESSEKAYAISTAEKKILDLTAVIQDGEAQVASLNDEVSTLGTEMAAKERKLLEVTDERKAKSAEFKATEAALVTSVDQLSRAMVIIKREMGAAFLQMSKVTPKQRLQAAMNAISKVLDAAWINQDTKKSLSGLMQTAVESGDDLTLSQPQAKVSAYESHSGGIVEQIGDMKEKAEETLSGARQTEMKEGHNFQMMAQSLNDAITNIKEKLSAAKSSIAAYTEENGKAKGELEETTKTKAADTAYLETLKQECSETATAFDERQKSAKEEMAVIEKAKSILAEGVKVFMQASASVAHKAVVAAKKGDDDDDDDSKDGIMRKRVVNKLKDLSHEFKSYALMEMVSVASSDPFEKVRGLIEQMIEKLVTEANEEATQKAFCDEETTKSKAAQSEKSMTADKLTSRIDKASTTKAQLEQGIKDLEAEIAELDAGNAESTKMRTEEKATNTKAASDFKLAAEAVTGAIGVLKEYYESALIQVSQSSKKAPSFGGAKSDAASSIISILEMSEENFTKLYMETETEESAAEAAYKKLMDENKVSKATKLAEVKGSQSEIKSLEVALKNNGEDLGMTNKELDAVMAYLAKLKPQCETKVMSYAEKKARREAEIAGLKEALSILDGPALVQKSVRRHLRA
jgi:predicted  nucleic acid-binding Zn-ribbon protein